MHRQMFQHVASVPTPAWTHSAADVVLLVAVAQEVEQVIH